MQQNTVWSFMVASVKASKLVPRHASFLGLFHSFSKIISTNVYFVRPGLPFLFQNIIPDLPFLFHNIIKTGVYLFIFLRISLLDYGRDIIDQDTNLLFNTITDSNPKSWKVIIIIKLYNMILSSFTKCWIHINLSERWPHH